MTSKKKILKRLKDAKIAYNSVMTRLAAHDEEFEAMGESIEGLGHLSKCGMLNEGKE